MAYGIQDPIDLARLIMGMSYGGMMEVADALVQMNANGERDVKTINGMASTLFDWAEATTEDADERARVREAAKAAKAAA
jgi:hypothetical protein